MRTRIAAGTLICVLLALLLAAALNVLNVDDAPKETISLPAQALPPGSPPVTVDADQQQSPQEQADASAPAPATEGPAIHEDARDETPPGVPAADVAKGLRDSTAQGTGPPVPVGGAQNYSCPNRIVRNSSSRNGQKVLLFVLHYTVSRPGSLDVIRGLFDRPSFGASSTFGIEFTGRCQTWVSPKDKAWTQGNFNGRSESVEIVATGSETRAQWLASPLIKRGILASLVRDRLRANGLPLRRVDPNGCDVQSAGWTDHNSLECGNSHHDVTPNFPFDVFARQVTAGDQTTSADRVTCRKLNAYRRAGRPRGGTYERRSIRRRQALTARGVTCTPRGPVRR